MSLFSPINKNIKHINISDYDFKNNDDKKEEELIKKINILELQITNMNSTIEKLTTDLKFINDSKEKNEKSFVNHPNENKQCLVTKNETMTTISPINGNKNKMNFNEFATGVMRNINGFSSTIINELGSTLFLLVLFTIVGLLTTLTIESIKRIFKK